jgi:prevent-host-death family protein
MYTKHVQMPKTKALNVSEARRDLPKLLHRIAEGGGPIAIGVRGKGQAVLVNLEEYEALRARRHGATGWDDLKLEVVGPPDLDADLAAIRGHLSETIERRAEKLRPATRTRKRA